MFINKILSAVNTDPVLYTDMMGVEYRTPLGADRARHYDQQHHTMRLGLVMQCMDDWDRAHPDVTKEQRDAAVVRFAFFISSNPSFFKRLKLQIQLMKRTDLRTSIED
jgi:hypothetical protein